MWKLIIIVIVLYYIILLWKYRDAFFKSRKPNKDIPAEIPQDNGKDTSVMGQSRFLLGQEKPSEAIQSQFSKPMENDSTFAAPDSEDTPQPMDITFEATYADDEETDEIEEEEIACFTGENQSSAQGVSFEEMGQAVRIVRQENASESEERQALQTFSTMEQSGLYDKMIDQINGGRRRVAEMLGKYDFVFVAPLAATAPNDWKTFDMNDYM